MYKSLLCSALLACLFTQDAAAHEMTGWQKEAKAAALKWHEKPIEGHAFGYGNSAHNAKNMSKLYSKRTSKWHETPVGNLLPKDLKKLFTGRVIILHEPVANRWDKSYSTTPSEISIRAFTKDHLFQCNIEIQNTGQSMKHKISGFSYWDTKPAVG